MRKDIPVPHLTTAESGPLHHVEKIILNKNVAIESWFREKWQSTPPSITSSVDLRHAGFKLAPVDTNLFPAGFNNLNADFLPLCIQATQAVMKDSFPNCKNVLILPENHTRNHFYLQSLATLRDILMKAGFVVRIGSLDPEFKTAVDFPLNDKDSLRLEPIFKVDNKIKLQDFEPCLLLLNNDLSTGIPSLLEQLNQPVHPTSKLGWSSRLKSDHFQFYNEVVTEFTQIVDMDSWLINPYFTALEGVDFMAQEGVESMAKEVDKLLAMIRLKYKDYGIVKEPFVVVKADNGTYGMSVMMVNEGAKLRQLNRKQRTKMAATKGSQKVSRVLIQEGVYTFETTNDGSVAEPVVYMIGQFVVGGFYRVHQGKGADENLNAPGMHFEPLAFSQACNMPRNDLEVIDCPNRFYVYGVIARLAALAAAREIAAVGDKL